jgi:hypothetical protein
MLIARNVAARVKVAEQPVKRRAVHDDEEEDHFSIAHNKTSLSFFKEQEAVIVGRMKSSDVLLQDEGVSRVHCIILLVPQRSVICVDVGSALGISTVRRSSEKPCESSLPNQRCVLAFDWGEVAVLMCGKEQVCLSEGQKKDQKDHSPNVLDPKLCFICFENPRSVTFACNHFVCCGTCGPKLRQCPVCRKNIDSKTTIAGDFFVNSHALK